MRWLTPLACLAAHFWLAACALDREDALRADLSAWVDLAETRHFTSNSSCTVALFTLHSSMLKSDAPPRVNSIDIALTRIAADQPVLFEMPGKSPDAISQDVMSRDLARGIGLISSGIGPTRACMDDWVMRGTYAMLTSSETHMIYAPAMNALLLIYPPEDFALFLRGSV